jgi:hypothetical protein
MFYNMGLLKILSVVDLISFMLYCSIRRSLCSIMSIKEISSPLVHAIFLAP